MLNTIYKKTVTLLLCLIAISLTGCAQSDTAAQTTPAGGASSSAGSISIVLTDPATGVSLTNISLGSPAKVTATVTDATGASVPNAVVTFTTTATLATMTPSTGTAVTNAAGVASIQIDAASMTAAGATTISATANVAGGAVTSSMGFSVSAANAVLGSFTVGTNPLSPYATTSVSIPVTGVPVTTAVTINFSSICASSGKATLPASVQTVNGVATATYVDKGCASTDTITASVAGLAGSKTVSLTVQQPGAASIQFVSATPSTIVLKGTGGVGLSESSLVVFKVVDNNNQPINGVTVQFDLTTRVGGILLDGASVPVSKPTDSNGDATVSVQSGTVPTPVWVTATMTTPNLSTQSNLLRISTGRPVQDRFSLSVGSHNIEGYSFDGVTTTVGVIASDRLGNPVPDGTAVIFYAEGGQIGASCLTGIAGTAGVAGVTGTTGQCSVTFTSANPRPTLDSEPNGIVTKGRVTVVAYSLGEESFIDLNNNNIYDSGEPFTDLGDVFYDNNENGFWDAGEPIILFAANNQSCTNVIPSSPFAISKTSTCDGVWGPAHVRQSNMIVMSGSRGFVNMTRPTVAFVPGTTAPSATYSMGGATVCDGTFSFYAFDQNRNPLPSGTALAVPSMPSTLSATISPTTVGDSLAAGGTQHSLLISKSKTAGVCATLGTGTSVNVTLTTPKGTVSTATFLITD